MTLYEIVKALQNAQGNLNKQAILMEHKDNELFKEFMRVTYDPSINFWQKKITKHKDNGLNCEFGLSHIEGMLYHLAERNITGRQAERWVGDLYATGNEECKELIKLMLGRSIGASVGDTMVLKTWNNLYFIPPYMRCSLLNDKTRKNFPDGETFACQLKADGMYMSLFTSGKGYTRQGNAFPQWLVSELLVGADYSRVNPVVLLGEVLVNKLNNGERLSRQEGNGILNSILKGADQSEFDEYEFYIECWDMLSVDDFEAGNCNITYDKRFSEMQNRIEWEFEHALVIPTYFVDSLDEAFAINNKFVADGLEGSVIKTLSHKWKDGTSNYNVKLKIAIELDLEITHVTEGTGKAAGSMGSVGVKSRDGVIQCDVGTGWSDEDRAYIYSIRDTIVGSILATKANDIISKRGSDIKSLFLPVAVEIRLDKTVADSYDECVAILNSAKGLK